MCFNSSENKHKIHQNSHVSFDLRLHGDDIVNVAAS